MHGRVFQPLALILLIGCSDAGPEAVNPANDASPQSAAFDLSAAGTVSGRVVWQGDPPLVSLLDMRTDPPVARGKTPNPNAPEIDATRRGVANAVVFLRGIDAGKGRPWHHPPVRVEMRDVLLHIRQGQTVSRVGFVRTGDAIEMVSREPILHGLEVRGAAFFSLRFVEPDVPATRRLANKGLVELRSAMPYCWMRAYLLVDDHPYYARTGPAGRFTLEQVPPGSYQVVCWMPNWHIVRKERDPENGLVNRLLFAPPVEVEEKVTIEPGESREVSFRLSAALFAR